MKTFKNRNVSLIFKNVEKFFQKLNKFFVYIHRISEKSMNTLEIKKKLNRFPDYLLECFLPICS